MNNNKIDHKAIIRFGNDNSKADAVGAKLKWEDITGIRSGTRVNVLSNCPLTKVAVVELAEGGQSPCGNTAYNRGSKRLVPNAALNYTILDDILENSTPDWQVGKNQAAF